MNKFAAVTLFFLLLGTNAFSMSLIFVESDVYAVEIESQSRSDADAAQAEPSAEIEERQEESAILTPLNLFSSEYYARYFLDHTDKTLIGASPNLVIPPNI